MIAIPFSYFVTYSSSVLLPDGQENQCITPKLLGVIIASPPIVQQAYWFMSVTCKVPLSLSWNAAGTYDVVSAYVAHQDEENHSRKTVGEVGHMRKVHPAHGKSHLRRDSAHPAHGG